MPSKAEAARVLVVGLGHMGAPMAARLAAAGVDVTGFDSAADRRVEGVASATSLTDAIAAADVVLLMLPTSTAVEAVLTKTADRLAPGAVVVDMGSTDPLVTRTLAERLAAAGYRLVDAPVSGGVAGAVAGSLTIMVGGEPDDVDPLVGLLGHLGTVRHVGPVGAGHALKALNNLMSAAHLMVTSEALVAGKRFGLDVATMLEVVNTSSGRSGSSETKWPRFVVPGTYDAGFGAALMLKDVRTAVGLIEAVGMKDALSLEVLRSWTEAVDALPEGADHTEIARLLLES